MTAMRTTRSKHKSCHTTNIRGNQHVKGKSLYHIIITKKTLGRRVKIVLLV